MTKKTSNPLISSLSVKTGGQSTYTFLTNLKVTKLFKFKSLI
jgi:hypothetical protein